MLTKERLRKLSGAVPWPMDFEDRYVRAGFWRDQNLCEWLADGARRFPRTFLADASVRLERPEFLALVNLIAARLRVAGLAPGETAVLQMSNRLDGLATVFACAKVGVIPLLAIPELGPHELSSFIDRIGAVALIATPESFERCTLVAAQSKTVRAVHNTSALAAEGNPSDGCDHPAPRTPSSAVGVFLVSGGTTGVPKVVPHPHRSWLYLGRCVAEVCGFNSETIYLAAMPLAHGWAMSNGVLATLGAGGSLVLSPTPAPTVAFELIRRHRVTHSGLIPPLAKLWTDAQRALDSDLSSLRSVLVGGSKPDAATLLATRDVLGCDVHQGFGMTEGLCGIQPPGLPVDQMLRDQGSPVSVADEIRVVDDEGHDVQPGEVGQLLVRGPYTIRGYFNDPEGNASAFLPGGWYCSGDLVRLVHGRNVIFEGRVKEQINRGGEKVSEREVEELIRQHPGIVDVAVVGAPDDRYGEAVVAFTVGEPCTVDELASFLRDRGLARYKHPTLVHRLEALPLTPVGRVAKRVLRQWAHEPKLILRGNDELPASPEIMKAPQ